MKLCAISFKECWQDSDGLWYSDGGFPLQMDAIGSLFAEMTLLVTVGKPRSGGLPLPTFARIVPLRKPLGQDGIRKLDIIRNFPYYLAKIQKYIYDADVVHTPLPGDIPLIAMILAILNRKYLIARYGGSWFHNTQTTLMNRVTRGIMRFCAGGKNLMLATGFRLEPPAPQMHWIFSSPLTTEYIQEIHPEFNRGLSVPPQLAYIGRLSPEKGVKYLIEALSKLKKQRVSPIPQLTLIGNGPQYVELQDYVAEQDCSEIVYFAGQLNRAELSKILMKMDLCVQPSLTEGFSKAWLDAMAHGLPVLASNVGAADVVIGYNHERGWLTNPGNSDMLADILQNILTEDFDWSSVRLQCRQYAENLTLEKWSQHIGILCSAQWGVDFQNGKLNDTKYEKT